MADKRIQDLTPATSVGTSDRFVLEQSGQAKSLTGQVLINDLATALDGHGGISSIEKTSTSGLTDTYTITYADNSTSTFQVKNGKAISSISKTAGTGTNLTDTYTITYNDGTAYTFTLTNGKSISSIEDKWAVSSSNMVEPSTWYNDPQTMTSTNRYEWHYQIITFNDGTTLDTDTAVVGVYGDTGDADHVYIKWADDNPTQDSDMLNYPSNYIGICTTTADSAPTSYTDYEWFQYKGATGDTGNGIVSVTLDSTSGLVDTYKVLFDDNTYTSFNVTNGSQISEITKTSTSGLTDTYTVTLTNGDATTFNVVNGKSITSITNVDVTHVAGHTDEYRINFNDGDAFTFSIYNGTNGSGSVATVDGIPSDGYQNVPLLVLGSGAPATTTAGLLKQRYFDQTNSNLYICTGIDTSGSETTYTWQGATSITVDSALSTLSTNPVQNAVLTALLGTTVLNTTAQTLTGAVNELDAKIGSTALPTTAQTLTGAIAEHETDLSGKVAKAGDTMTGDLTVNNSGASSTLDVVNSSSNRIKLTADTEGGNLRLEKGTSLAEMDTYTMNTSGTGYLRIYVNDGQSGVNLKFFRFNQDGSFVDGNGVNTGTLNSDKVSKSGDTMTGMLFQRSPNIDINQTQSAWGDNYLLLLDKNNARVAGVRAYQNNGFDGIQIAGHNGNTENALRLGTKSDGSRNVYVTDPAAWRSALETIKYANISGTDTTSGASDYAGAIKTILTSAAPQSWDRGVYAGSIVKTNSTSQVAWTGMYIINVYNPSGNWGTQGIAVVQGHIYNIWYRSGAWTATQMAEA